MSGGESNGICIPYSFFGSSFLLSILSVISSSSPSSVILRNLDPVSVFGFLLETKVELVLVVEVVLVDLRPDEVIRSGGVVAFQPVLQLLLSWLARPHFTHLPSLLLLSFLSSAMFLLARLVLLLEQALVLERVLSARVVEVCGVEI